MKFIKTVVATVLALIVLCGIAFGIGCGVTGTYDVREWFKKEEGEGGNGDKPNEDGDKPTLDPQSEILLTVKEQSNSDILLKVMPLSVSSDGDDGASALAVNGYQLHATVYDQIGRSPASIQKVQWSWKFKDESATENLDYYLDCKVNGADLDFVLQYNQRLPHTVLVTCTSTLNPEISATAEVEQLTYAFELYAGIDYDVVDYQNVFFYANLGQSVPTDHNMRLDYCKDVYDNYNLQLNFLGNVEYQGGSLANEITDGTFKVEFSDTAKSIFNNFDMFGKYHGSDGYLIKNVSNGKGGKVSLYNIFTHLTKKTIDDGFWTIMNENISDICSVPIFTVTYNLNLKYGGTAEFSYDVYFDYVPEASNIEIDNDILILE